MDISSLPVRIWRWDGKVNEHNTWIPLNFCFGGWETDSAGEQPARDSEFGSPRNGRREAGCSRCFRIPVQPLGDSRRSSRKSALSRARHWLKPQLALSNLPTRNIRHIGPTGMMPHILPYSLASCDSSSVECEHYFVLQIPPVQFSIMEPLFEYLRIPS